MLERDIDRKEIIVDKEKKHDKELQNPVEALSRSGTQENKSLSKFETDTGLMNETTAKKIVDAVMQKHQTDLENKSNACASCGKELPKEGNYCRFCGNKFGDIKESQTFPEIKKKEDQDDINWEKKWKQEKQLRRKLGSILNNEKLRCKNCEKALLEGKSYCWNCGKIFENLAIHDQFNGETASRIKCKYCGKKRPKGKDKCWYCGKSYYWGITTENLESPPSQQPSVEKKNDIFIHFLIFLSGILLVVFGALILEISPAGGTTMIVIGIIIIACYLMYIYYHTGCECDSDADGDCDCGCCDCDGD